MKKTLITTIILIGILFSSFSDDSIKLSKLWETDDVFMTPESVVYDSQRNCLYVSNFNDKLGFRNSGDTIFDECISKLDLEGNIIDFKWVDSLLGPTGIAMFKDTLYVVERECLTKIDVNQHSIFNRLKIQGTGLLNDIAIAENGDIYISDSRDKKIYKVKDNHYEIWFQDSILQMPNGLFIMNDKLIVGNKGDANMFSISLKEPDKSYKTILKNTTNGIDGIKKINNKYVISWQYNMLMEDENGNFNIILDTSEGGNWVADFEFIKEKGIIIVPTLLTNKIVAYKIETNIIR